MKVHEILAEGTGREDGQLEARLKNLDTNIKMFSAPFYEKNASVLKRRDEMIKWKDLLKKFYAGEIERKDVPYGAWELTSSIPSWGTHGT